MEITVKKTVEEKVQITLPAFFRSKTQHFYYKVYSEDHCLAVHSEEIGIKHATIFMVLDYEPCTESEFLDMYNKVNDTLCQLATV